jgi:hypothetical protein
MSSSSNDDGMSLSQGSQGFAPQGMQGMDGMELESIAEGIEHQGSHGIGYGIGFQSIAESIEPEGSQGIGHGLGRGIVLQGIGQGIEPQGSLQGIVPPDARKRQKSRVPNPIVHSFKVFNPTYSQWYEPIILRLHLDNTCSTARAPDSYHGSWRFTENNDLHVRWHYSGLEASVKDHRYRRIEKTDCWELVDYGSRWYSMLLPTAP